MVIKILTKRVKLKIVKKTKVEAEAEVEVKQLEKMEVEK